MLFNNSAPAEISYYVQSLETGHRTVQTVAGSSLKKPQHPRAHLQLTEGDEESEEVPEVDPRSALVLRNQNQQLDVAKLPSIRPTDSLSFVPLDLASSQQILFLSVSEPSLISLKSVTDRGGDRFHITPHREALIIECPTGGHFVESKEGRIVRKGDKSQPAELRCLGEDEVVDFQARGVGSLKAHWTKKSKDTQVSGVIEGIESEVEAADELAMARRDKVARTHNVPLRVSHDRAGVYTVSLTSITDSMRNTYTPSGPSSEKIFNVIPRPSATFACPGVVQLLVNKTATFSVQLDGSGPLHSPMDVSYAFKPISGKEAMTTTLKMSKRSEGILVTEPGTFTLLDISGQCAGAVLEPSTCRVELVPPPTLALKVESLHEGAMDIGVTASFDFAGTAPFTVQWTEQRKGSRLVSRSQRFESHHGEIVLQPEQEGLYTYVSDRFPLCAWLTCRRSRL